MAVALAQRIGGSITQYQLSGLQYDEFISLIEDLLQKLKADESFRDAADARGLDLAVFDELVEKIGPDQLVRATPIEAGFDKPLLRIDFTSLAPFVGQTVWDNVLLPAVQRNHGDEALQETDSATSVTAPVAKSGPQQYTVYYATNRRRISADSDTPEFGAEREQCGTLHYGSCDVVIPQSHKFGQVRASWWKRWLPWRNDRLEIVGRRTISDGDFCNALSSDLEQSKLGGDVLLFVHGYNVTFEEAAIRAAQCGVDLKVPGATAFFSWPSRGATKDYVRDEAAIAASEASLKEFIVRLKTQTGARRVHIIAHSMGNRGLLRAMQRLAADSKNVGRKRFGQVILAAADEDVDLFGDLASHYARFCKRTTLYLSPQDWALRASKWLHGHLRVGFAPPVATFEGLETVEVPGFNLLNLGHGYFAEADAVLHDMFDLIRNDTPPDDRQRLQRCTNDKNQTYWQVKR